MSDTLQFIAVTIRSPTLDSLVILEKSDEFVLVVLTSHLDVLSKKEKMGEKSSSLSRTIPQHTFTFSGVSVNSRMPLGVT